MVRIMTGLGVIYLRVDPDMLNACAVLIAHCCHQGRCHHHNYHHGCRHHCRQGLSADRLQRHMQPAAVCCLWSPLREVHQIDVVLTSDPKANIIMHVFSK